MLNTKIPPQPASDSGITGLRRRLFLLAAAAPGLSAHAAPPPPALLTVLDGEAFLLRGAARLALAEGVALQDDDLLDVPPTARLAQLELADGVALALGPDSRSLLAPRLGGARAGGRLYLLTGWLKLRAPAGVTARVLSPVLDVTTAGGTVVLRLHAGGASVFVESGEARVQRGSTSVVLQAGELFNAAHATATPPERADRPDPAFVQALPRAFMDRLPTRFALLRDQLAEPRALGPLTYADAQPWIDAEPALRRAYFARWRPLASQPEFRQGLVAGLKNHPEWRPILSPPPPRPAPAAEQRPAGSPADGLPPGGLPPVSRPPY